MNDSGRYWNEGDEYIEHSSGPWSKHKYIKKIGEGANAVYQYARDAAGGKQKEAAEQRADSQRRNSERAVWNPQSVN